MNSEITKILKMITGLLKAKGVILVSSCNVLTTTNFFNEEINDLLLSNIKTEVKSDHLNVKELEKSESLKALSQNLSANIIIKNIPKINTDYLVVFLDKKETEEDKDLFENILPTLNYLSEFIENYNDYSELQSRFTETIENISTTIYSSDKDAKQYYFISSSIKKLIGFSPEEIYQNRMILLRSILPQDFALFKNFIRKVNKGQYAEVDYRFIDIGGNVKHVRHTGTPIFKNGNVARVVGMIKDITTEKLLIDQLTKSEDKLNLLLNTASSLIFTLDRSGYFVSVNSKGALELGFNEKEMIGKHFLEFIDEDCKANIAIAFQKILTTSNTVDFEAEFIDPFGKKIVYGVQAKATREDGKVTSMLGIGSDITHKRKDESKLNELNTKLTEANRIISIERDRAKHQITVLEELNKLKNDFISSVSHELRTPLASIVGFAETIASDEDLPREVAMEFNNIILTEGKRLAKLINDILDFSKLETNKEELNISTFDIITLLKELYKNYSAPAKSKNLEFLKEIPEAEIIIEADKERITKAIGNLISNAIKFTPEEGRITIIIQDFLKEVEIIVSDTGIGITPEKMPKLFEKFSKTISAENQSPGAGFGLATVKQIVDLHQGLVQVSSEPGQGSSFIVKLPKKIK